MRAQYHFRRVGNDTLIWDVKKLVAAARDLPRRRVPLTEIRELDEPYWFEATDDRPSCRAVAEHARLIEEATLDHPIILSADGGVMDGMHRVCKAWLDGADDIEAVRFDRDPSPDYRNVEPSDLPY